MGLLDEAIREHLELKRRRGADAVEISREEGEALGPVHRSSDGTPDLASAPGTPSPEQAAPEPYGDVPPALDEDEPDWGEDVTAIHDPEPSAAFPAPPPPASAPPPAASQPPPPAFAPPPVASEPPPPAFAPPPAAPNPPPAAYELPPAVRPPVFYNEPASPPPPFEPLMPASAAPPPPPQPPPRAADPAPLDDPPAAPQREKSRLLGGLRLRRNAGDEPKAASSGTHDRDFQAREPVEDDPFYEPPPAAYAPPPSAYQPPPGRDHDIVPTDKLPAGEDELEETPQFLEETPDHDRLWFEQRPPRDFDFDK